MYLMVFQKRKKIRIQSTTYFENRDCWDNHEATPYEKRICIFQMGAPFSRVSTLPSLGKEEGMRSKEMGFGEV